MSQQLRQFNYLPEGEELDQVDQDNYGGGEGNVEMEADEYEMVFSLLVLSHIFL